MKLYKPQGTCAADNNDIPSRHGWDKSQNFKPARALERGTNDLIEWNTYRIRSSLIIPLEYIRLARWNVRFWNQNKYSSKHKKTRYCARVECVRSVSVTPQIEPIICLAAAMKSLCSRFVVKQNPLVTRKLWEFSFGLGEYGFLLCFFNNSFLNFCGYTAHCVRGKKEARSRSTGQKKTCESYGSRRFR